MSGDQEMGTCSVCQGEDKILQRTTFNYDLKCECHSPNHFESVKHCGACIPVEPKITKVSLSQSVTPGASNLIVETSKLQKK